MDRQPGANWHKTLQGQSLVKSKTSLKIIFCRNVNGLQTNKYTTSRYVLF